MQNDITLFQSATMQNFTIYNWEKVDDIRQKLLQMQILIIKKYYYLMRIIVKHTDYYLNV